MAATTKIQVLAADNEVILLASTPAGSSELLHYKSGYNKPVDVTLFPGTILSTGEYQLTMIGINWGGPANYKIVMTTADGKSQTFGSTSPGVGVTWSQTVPMSVTAGQ